MANVDVSGAVAIARVKIDILSNRWTQAGYFSRVQ